VGNGAEKFTGVVPSASTISRLNQTLTEHYETWRERPLQAHYRMKSTFSRSMTFHRSCVDLFDAQMRTLGFFSNVRQRTDQIDTFTTETSCVTIVWAVMQDIHLQKIPASRRHEYGSLTPRKQPVKEGAVGECSLFHFFLCIPFLLLVPYSLLVILLLSLLLRLFHFFFSTPVHSS
jgi:hypothetical protein